MRERINEYRVLVGKSEGKKHLKDLGVDGTIILKWSLNTMEMGVDCIGLTQDRNNGGLL
jgi:hypothetical protein